MPPGNNTPLLLPPVSQLYLSLGADHPVGRELVVEASLHAAEEAGIAALQGVVASEGAADMAADIEAGPVIDDRRRGIDRSLGIGAGRDVSRKGLAGERGQRDVRRAVSFSYSIPVTNVATSIQTT